MEARRLQNNMDRKKPNTHTLVPKALNLGYHARPNGAASQCHKLVVTVPQLRHHTPIDIAQTDREKRAPYSKTAPKDVVSDAEIASDHLPLAKTKVDRLSIGGVK
jgi:hypothetical protein